MKRTRPFRSRMANGFGRLSAPLLGARAPLIVHVKNGRRFVIPHDDYAHISQSQNYLVFTDEKGRVELIQLPSIESITVAKEPAA